MSAAVTDGGPDFDQDGSTQEVATNVLTRLTRAAGRVTSEQNRLLRDVGVSPSAFAILIELDASHGQGAEPCMLADRLSVTRPSVCGLLDRLEARGLVRRGPHHHDGRRVIVQLTGAGAHLLAAHRPAYETGLRPMVAALSVSELGRLSDLLDRIGA